MLSLPNSGIICRITCKVSTLATEREYNSDDDDVTDEVESGKKKNIEEKVLILEPDFSSLLVRSGSKISTNFLAAEGSFIYFDNNLKIMSSLSPGLLTNFLIYHDN